MCDTRNRMVYLCAAAVMTAAPAAFAAHPSLPDDTGTQGERRFELELAFQQTLDGDVRSFRFGPQLSNGLAPDFDLIVRPTWVDDRSSTADGNRSERGIGDTELGFKWRFHDADDASLGVRAGVALPTGSESRGLGSGTPSYYALLIATVATAPWTFSANVGYMYNEPTPDQRRDVWAVAAGAVWAVQEGLKLTADVGAERDGDPTRSTWPAVVRVGAIYTVNRYWDIDVGYQSPINDAAERHVFLVGATVRW